MNDKNVYEYDFSFELDPNPSKAQEALKYKDFKVARKGEDIKINGVYVDERYLNASNEVVFSLLTRISEHSLPVATQTRFAYLVCHSQGDKIEILCTDRINIKQKSGESIAVVPANYRKSHGINIGNKKLFASDFFNAVIGYIIDGEKFVETKTNKNEVKKWLKVTKLECDKPVIRKWWHRCGLVLVRYKIDQTGSDQPFEFFGTVMISRFIFGEIASAAPIPPFRRADSSDKEFENPKHSVILANYNQDKQRHDLSEIAFENLNTLTRHLQFREPQKTWITGDPGSGKDIFANAIHHGSISSFNYNMEVRSAAGIDYEELNSRLFTAEEGQPCLVEKAEFFPCDVTDGRFESEEAFESDRKWFTENLAENSYGGTIFLDEFDKVREPEIVYGSMLRVLESAEYIKRIESPPAKGQHTKELPQEYNKLNWIFAGAFSQQDPSKIVPPDFWSRLTGHISVRNPLRDHKEYAATLFLFFYVKEAITLLPDENGRKLTRFVEILEKNDTEKSFVEIVFSRIIDLHKKHSEGEPFELSENLIKAANYFSDLVITSPGITSDKVDSVRAIRQAAIITFHEMRTKIIENSDVPSAWNGDTFSDTIKDAFELARNSLILSRGP